MTFKILLDDSNKIVCQSIVCSVLDPKLPNLCVEPDIENEDNTSSIKKDFDPDSGTASISPTHKKEQVHPVPTQRQTRSQTRICSQLLQNKNDPLNNVIDTISPSLPNPDVTSKDPPPDDDNTIPDTFFYIKSNVEKSTEPPLWKPFEVTKMGSNVTMTMGILSLSLLAIQKACTSLCFLLIQTNIGRSNKLEL